MYFSINRNIWGLFTFSHTKTFATTNILFPIIKIPISLHSMYHIVTKFFFAISSHAYFYLHNTFKKYLSVDIVCKVETIAKSLKNICVMLFFYIISERFLAGIVAGLE